MSMALCAIYIIPRSSCSSNMLPISVSYSRPPDKSVYWNIIFLFLNQNICCGYSKEPSQWDCSFEHPKYMFKLMAKEINAILGAHTILIWAYAHSFESNRRNRPVTETTKYHVYQAWSVFSTCLKIQWVFCYPYMYSKVSDQMTGFAQAWKVLEYIRLSWKSPWK